MTHFVDMLYVAYDICKSRNVVCRNEDWADTATAKPTRLSSLFVDKLLTAAAF